MNGQGGAAVTARRREHLPHERPVSVLAEATGSGRLPIPIARTVELQGAPLDGAKDHDSDSFAAARASRPHAREASPAARVRAHGYSGDARSRALAPREAAEDDGARRRAARDGWNRVVRGADARPRSVRGAPRRSRRGGVVPFAVGGGRAWIAVRPVRSRAAALALAEQPVELATALARANHVSRIDCKTRASSACVSLGRLLPLALCCYHLPNAQYRRRELNGRNLSGRERANARRQHGPGESKAGTTGGVTTTRASVSSSSRSREVTSSPGASRTTRRTRAG